MERRELLRYLVAVAAAGCSPNVRAAFQTPQEGQLDRIVSKDGTPLAVECAGAGPTLLIVHGGIGDRTRWAPMVALFSAHFIACAMDRRGHGQSGDSADYSLRKEAEDVAAVVDSRPGDVFVLGHSYGAVAALEATFLTKRISKLILYEPPMQEPTRLNLTIAGRLETMIRAGRREEAVATFLGEVVKQSESEVEAMRTRPAWAKMVATIDSQPRQMRALARYRFDAKRMRQVTMPTLLLVGSDTASPSIKQAIRSLETSLRDPTLVVLKGQQHNAMDTGRDQLAEAVTAFLQRTQSKPQGGRRRKRAHV